MGFTGSFKQLQQGSLQHSPATVLMRGVRRMWMLSFWTAAVRLVVMRLASEVGKEPEMCSCCKGRFACDQDLKHVERQTLLLVFVNNS